MQRIEGVLGSMKTKRPTIPREHRGSKAEDRDDNSGQSDEVYGPFVVRTWALISIGGIEFSGN